MRKPATAGAVSSRASNRIEWPNPLIGVTRDDIRHAGIEHDYVVMAPDNRPMDRSVELSQLAKERATRRLGTDQLSEVTAELDPRLLG